MGVNALSALVTGLWSPDYWHRGAGLVAAPARAGETIPHLGREHHVGVGRGLGELATAKPTSSASVTSGRCPARPGQAH